MVVPQLGDLVADGGGAAEAGPFSRRDEVQLHQ